MIFFKRLVSLVWVTIASLCFWCIPHPVWAETPDGQTLFNANCSACHIGGNNVIIAHKTLKKDALEKYEMNSLEAIRNQVINGKNAMPSFKGRLSEEEIAAIATYVLQQSESGWSG